VRNGSCSSSLELDDDSFPGVWGALAALRERNSMNKLARVFASFSFVCAVVVGSLGVVSVEAACSSACSESEDKACSDTYSTCIQEAATAADLGKCQSCVDSYCSCYDKCGNTCEKDKLSTSCKQ
jgi:hypothetical protein